MEQEKRERIINAALKEFARNGYEKASTNEIIKEANISKGSLFNYFKSKKELYLFLFEYTAETIDKIYDEIDYSETDFFKRTREIGLIKFKIMKKFPQAFDFLKAVGNESFAEVKSEIEKVRKHTIERGLEMGYKNIDWTKFRDDIDFQKMMNIINWTMLSFSEQQRNKVNSFKNISMEVLEEWDEYFDILKLCFYKKGEE
ncbi:TetR family transcriptional regulator [Clostridium bovifaecis]|uniref:TetR family transcriptional regulator n=1 Tax=Clostridium bovifaecis TaxID=2184719 RepID=A0A6I6ESY7_9CLOT|nr:TetR family transcriptional regulator [Clostridium bovifaecis]